MKQILVLGAGFVARPLVHYLLALPDVRLTVASRTLKKAERLVSGHPHGRAEALDVDDKTALTRAIDRAHVVVSLLPWVHHMKVAEKCLALGRHLVTTSYVKPEMAALDAEARKKGLLFLNEIGVDPGIDHMAAMQVIDGVKQAGGQITEFRSYCGGLPAPAHNTNPLGYKFSWSPAGVLLAAKNDGRYLCDGKVQEIPSGELFRHYRLVDVPGAGTFEAYVNRDALPYLDIYGIETARSIYRGTLRNVGHCESWDAFARLGLLDQERIFDFEKYSPAQVLAQMTGSGEKASAEDIAAFLKIPAYSVIPKKLAWLGLLDDRKLPLKKASAFDMFAHVLQERLVYAADETDLLVQHHEFLAEYPDGRKEQITSTMVETGIPGGDTAMSRTVGLPAAIGVKLIIEGDLTLRGVHRPVLPAIYEPVLAELSVMGIRLEERRHVLYP